MEVPERMLNSFLLSAGDHAANIFNPGAVISGFKIPGVNKLGPFEENAATRGARLDPITVFAGKISDLAIFVLVT
ncbi:hypothetical protein IEQ34_000156 [Dendrobium chrysotoxum]|uniref:Uncharacterized protein n=1 Tax=Dendrobium chrysotoxum TaxID=161865 RepID=A0AAV7HSC5_DENCH|nr:hypothetical protein IEQ34_000156 [Dendrobium chrysotoxum]